MARVLLIALRMGPFGFLSFAGLLWASPVMEIAASLGGRTCSSPTSSPAWSEPAAAS